MKILVTGGAGYIGSVTARKLLDRGDEVFVVDALENGHRCAVDRRAKFCEADLRQPQFLEGILSQEKFGAVIHFAGYIESGESMKDPLKFFENNFSAGVGMLQIIRKHGIRNVIFSSTAGVYGNGQPPYNENSPIDTTSYYSTSKYFFEEALRAGSTAYGFRVVILRYFNAAGATMDGRLGEDHHPETHLIPLVIKTALGLSGEISLYGTDYPTPDGTAVRDYIHVEDLALAHIMALNRFSCEGPLYEIYNVGTGHGNSNTEVIEAVKRVSGKNLRVIAKGRREGDWAASFADCEKIHRDFGWKAKYSLDEIVESAYLWHKNNPQGFDDSQSS